MEARAEANAALARIHADLAHGSLVVGVRGNDDVHVLNDTLESLVQSFLLQLELEQSAIHLVHEENGLDALTDGLAQDSLSLHAHSRDAIDDDQGTVSDTKSSSHLRREIDVA